MLVRTQKIRLYPTKAQEQQMWEIVGACRFVWNHFLEQRKNHYLEHKQTLSYAQMARDLTKLRHETEWMSGIQSEPLQQSLRRLDRAYNRFFRKTSQFPNFKSKKQSSQSFQKHQDWRIRGNTIQVQSDLLVRYRGTISGTDFGSLVIKRVASGKWYATITSKISVKKPKRYSKAVGVDVGITTLATLSDGKKYENIRPQETLQKALTRAQRNMARKQIGSNRRNKAKVEVARVYEKIANVRSNHLHKVSHAITSKNHALIAVEDLSIKSMNGNLSASLPDVSLGEFMRQLEYKQEENGGAFVKIDRYFPSSKTCSSCDFVSDSMPLSRRSWKCPKCGTKHDRDINAAKMILKQGLAYSPRGVNVRPSGSSRRSAASVS